MSWAWRLCIVSFLVVLSSATAQSQITRPHHTSMLFRNSAASATSGGLGLDGEDEVEEAMELEAFAHIVTAMYATEPVMIPETSTAPIQETAFTKDTCHIRSEAQAFPTSGAHAWETFIVNGETFLAVANYGDDETVQVDSVIYKWDRQSLSFVLFQRIPTIGASFIKAYRWQFRDPRSNSHRAELNVGMHFLAITSFSDGDNYLMNSHVYIFDEAIALFKPLQVIQTRGAYCAEFFQVGANRLFLAIANEFDGLDFNVQSEIFEYDRLAGQFRAFQSINTHGVFSVEAFTLNGQTFLAVANDRNGSTFCISSEIYRFDIDLNLLVPFQSIKTHGCTHLKPFVISRRQESRASSTIPTKTMELSVISSLEIYLVAANFGNGAEHRVSSEVLTYDPVSRVFVHHQDLATSGAMAVEVFEIEQQTYMFIANNFGETTHNVDSQLFKWDTGSVRFTLHQLIPTQSAQFARHVLIDGDHYLAVANEYDGASYQTNSFLYKWCDGKFYL